VYWDLLFPTSNAAICLFWQILTGWSLTSASVFAAAFFRKYQLSGAYAVVGFLVVALGGMIMDTNGVPGAGPVTALSFLFPSMNFVFALAIYCRYAMQGLPIDMLHAPPGSASEPANSKVSAIELWAFLIVHIIVYPILAIIVEKVRHGIVFSHRTFDTSTEATENVVALQTSGLGKTYSSPWYKQLFSRKRTPGVVVALADLNLASQKRQILCLLGANGSGKTTTLDLIAGIQQPTAGSINIHATASQLGRFNRLFRLCAVIDD
jgi:ATP-binding cassette, subfamily A (ABC1), member 3